MTSRRWRAGNVVVWGVILLLATALAVGITALVDYSGWLEETNGAISVTFFGWFTFKKLRSDAPVDDHWSFHAMYVAMGLMMLLMSVREVMDPGVSRLLGLVGVVAAALMLFAAHRDISRWRRMPRPAREPRKRVSTGPKHLRPR